MNNDAVGHPVQLSPTMRLVIMWLCCAGAIGGLGCATFLAVDGAQSRKRAYYNKPVSTDTVYALARPDDKLAARIGNDNAIAFLGRERTYLLVEGGDKLSSVAAELNSSRLTLYDSRKLYIKKDVVWGSLSLVYRPAKDVSADETNKLATLGFTADRNGVYQLAVTVKGKSFPAARLNKDMPGSFDKGRKVAFYRSPDSMAPPDLKSLVTVPLGLAVDLALTPVYVLGFLVLVLSGV